MSEERPETCQKCNAPEPWCKCDPFIAPGACFYCGHISEHNVRFTDGSYPCCGVPEPGHDPTDEGWWCCCSKDDRTIAALRAEIATLTRERDEARAEVERLRETLASVETTELLASVEHARWSKWMMYLFTKGEITGEGGFEIAPTEHKRWFRQAATAYADLSEAEKESDRVEARVTQAALQVAADAMGKRDEGEEAGG